MRKQVTRDDYRRMRLALGLDPDAGTDQLGSRLRELRTECLLSLTEVAEMCELQGGKTIPYKWETGATAPDMPRLLMLADFYGTTIDYVLGRPGARRDSDLVAAAKAALTQRLASEELDRLTRAQRVALAWRMAQEVAPHAYPIRRIAGLTGYRDLSLFEELVRRGEGHISDVALHRLAQALGIPGSLLSAPL